MRSIKKGAVTPAMIKAIEKQMVVGYFRLLHSTCSTRAQHGGLMFKFKCLLRTSSHWTWRGTGEIGVTKVLPPDGEEGVLGIVVLPIGDQLSLCVGCVDISLGLHPRESFSSWCHQSSFFHGLPTRYLSQGLNHLLRLFQLIYLHTVHSLCKLCYFTATIFTPSRCFSLSRNWSSLPFVPCHRQLTTLYSSYLHTPAGFDLFCIISRIVISHLCILQHSSVLFFAPNFASTVPLPYHLSYLLVSSP